MTFTETRAAQPSSPVCDVMDRFVDFGATALSTWERRIKTHADYLRMVDSRVASMPA